MRRLNTLIIIILSIGIMVSACGEGTDKSETSEVTIYISDTQTVSLDIKKPSLLSSAKYFIKNLIALNEASAIPAGITDVRYTVSGSGMSAITGVASVANDAVKIVLYIPNGPQRHFVLDARYANSCVRYRGTTDVDLNGRPMTLNVSMALVSADLCPSNAANSGIDITFTINNSGNIAVSNVLYYVQYQVGGLDSCARGTAGVSAPIPADGSVAAGATLIYPTSNNYRIIIDPVNSITETDESNNEICSGTFCTSPPPLSIC
ncbi:MAG: hypothetical protein HZC10_07375 [Nitrospirae bacterium]|nr:hypothetical protein [Nitrospirota bacterium]